jgi:hypothetical protein
VYDFVAMPIRSIIPQPAENTYWYDTFENNLLQTCKLVGNEAQTIFARFSRNLAPVLVFSLKSAYHSPDTVGCTGGLIQSLLEGVNSSQNGKVNFDPLKEFSRYCTWGTQCDEYAEMLRPIYISIVRGALNGKRL